VMQERNKEDLALKIAQWVDKLRHISANGGKFAQNIYDKENYQTIQNIAIEMTALIAGKSFDEIEPFRDSFFMRPTPIAVCDAAVFNEEGKILLIRRFDTKKWAMPGGGTDVGETPAQAALREALEETGYHAEAVALVAIHDSRLHNSRSPVQMYQMTFLCKLLAKERENPPSHAHETLEIGWFSEAELPEDIDDNHITRLPEAFRVYKGDYKAAFD
jgi:8-oxo-dGTP pyrophosphatase MutT (NUDIX family)